MAVALAPRSGRIPEGRSPPPPRRLGVVAAEREEVKVRTAPSPPLPRHRHVYRVTPLAALPALGRFGKTQTGEIPVLGAEDHRNTRRSLHRPVTIPSRSLRRPFHPAGKRARPVYRVYAPRSRAPNRYMRIYMHRSRVYVYARKLRRAVYININTYTFLYVHTICTYTYMYPVHHLPETPKPEIPLRRSHLLQDDAVFSPSPN